MLTTELLDAFKIESGSISQFAMVLLCVGVFALGFGGLGQDTHEPSLVTAVLHVLFLQFALPDLFCVQVHPLLQVTAAVFALCSRPACHMFSIPVKPCGRCRILWEVGHALDSKCSRVRPGLTFAVSFAS